MPAVVLNISTNAHKECLDLTGAVRQAVRDSGVTDGLCHVMVLGATAAVIVNENDDPNIGVDLLRALDTAVAEHDNWLHDRVDNNAQSHILASMLGPSETVPVVDGELLLGTWQALMLVELDGPRQLRRVSVQLIAGQ